MRTALLSKAELHWLAGWLEGEGSFCAPPPSDPRRPRIVAQARDEDVVAEAGRLLRVKPYYENSERIKAHGWSPMWRLLLQGGRAEELMEALKPVMGARRTAQIDSALDAARRAQRLKERRTAA